MKTKTLSLFTGTIAFSLLAGALIGANLKRTYHVGEIAGNGGVIVKTGIARDSLVKYHPLLTPTDPYYTGEKKAEDPLYGSDDLFYQNVNMKNLGDIESVWDSYTGKGKMIAVIDSGIEHDHEEFYRNGECVISDLSASFETYYESDYDQEGDLTIKKVSQYGWSVLSHDWESDQSGSEWVDHGSNVASTAAAPINGKGIVGIAPDATILALKIDFYDESINGAIKYAADCGADVINLSLGGYAEAGYNPDNDPMQEAVTYAYNKGCIVVAAAGNESTDEKSYPACFKHVISVGSLDDYSDTFAYSYSNYNKSSESSYKEGLTVDICAPGSVVGAGVENPTQRSPKTLGYHYTSGTSFASPTVAGAAAVWKEKNPSGTQDQFEQDLFSSAFKCSDYSFRYYGNGNLDMYGLLKMEEESVRLDQTEIKLSTQDTSATLTATTKEGYTITNWSVDNNSVVTISGETKKQTASATLTVVGAGNATVTVTDSNGKTAKCAVVVEQYVPVTGINVAESIELQETRTLELNASVLPTNASNKTISYVSNNTSVATVDQNGKVTGVTKGTATLTLTAEEVTKTVNVSVTEKTEDDYQITFKKDTSSTQELNAQQIKDRIVSGKDYVKSISNPAKIFKDADFGLKFSTSNTNGSFTINLSNNFSINSITVNIARYDNDKDKAATFTVNNKTASNLTTSLKDYVLTFDGSETQTITLSASKRVYLSGLTITGNSGTQPQTKTLTGIRLDTTSVQKEFSVNDVFNSNGLKVYATYSDNSTAQVTNFSVSTPNMNTAGTKPVTVSYAEGNVTKTASYDIVVKEQPQPKTLTSIKLNTTYVQTQFLVNDVFNYNGLKVYAAYSDGSEAPVTSFNVTAPNMNTAGTKPVTVSYSEGNVTKTASYDIVVKEQPQVKTLTGIRVDASQAQTEFIVNDVFNYDGLKVFATYSDNSTSEVTGFTVTAPQMTKGTKDVAVSYTENSVTKTASYQVVIKDQVTPQTKTLTSIRLDTENVQKEFSVNDVFNYDGLKVFATYSDNSTSEVTGFTVTAPQMTAGKQKVNVSYTEGKVTKTASYDITVKETPVDPDKPVTPTNFCGGSVVATSAILSITALIGAGLVTLKRRKEK